MFTDATHIRINGERGVLYTGDGDRLYVRFGGSVTWRNFNPGALESSGQLSQLAETIKRQEGWNPGKANDMQRVIATRNKSKSDKTLTHFQLEGGGGFITLASAISQTRQGKIYAVVVEASTPYLRSFPGSEENFDDIVVPNPS